MGGDDHLRRLLKRVLLHLVGLVSYHGRLEDVGACEPQQNFLA